jgi:hypothetical protein
MLLRCIAPPWKPSSVVGTYFFILSPDYLGNYLLRRRHWREIYYVYLHYVAPRNVVFFDSLGTG